MNDPLYMERELQLLAVCTCSSSLLYGPDFQNFHLPPNPVLRVILSTVLMLIPVHEFTLDIVELEYLRE